MTNFQLYRLGSPLGWVGSYSLEHFTNWAKLGEMVAVFAVIVIPHNYKLVRLGHTLQPVTG